MITLAIIGIVAALTIPSLIQKQQEKAIVASLKKNYSVLSQILMKSYIDNGDYSDWDYSYGSGLNNGKQMHDWYKIYIKPYIKVISDGYVNASANFTLSDGTVIVVDDYDEVTTKKSCGVEVTSDTVVFFVDTNGKKGPNKKSRDTFCFIIPRNNGGRLIPGGRDYENCPEIPGTCTAKVLREGKINY